MDVLALEKGDICIIGKDIAVFDGWGYTNIRDEKNEVKKWESDIVYRFIDGKFVKIWERSRKLNKVEKALIEYAKSLGCKWITVGENWLIHGWKEKPCKINEKNEFSNGCTTRWESINRERFILGKQNEDYPVKITFVSRTDDKPYYIGNDRKARRKSNGKIR